MTPQSPRPALTADEVCGLLGLTGRDKHRQLRRAVESRAMSDRERQIGLPMHGVQ